VTTTLQDNQRQGGIIARLKVWRAKRRVSPGWTVVVALTTALLVMPIVSIVVLAFAPGDGVWQHLLRTTLPGSIMRTVWLMVGVGTITLVVGTSTAWLVTMYRFPGRDRLDWLLVIPLAMPTYIIAFCYVEILDYAGSLQTTLRTLNGWQNSRDYWFPEIRSLGGAIFVMSFVLYPYVYLSARASFLQQSVCTLEVARTLGETPAGTFWKVALPLARPALAAGVSLALMECLNDIGAVEYLGVTTLTVSVYTTWLERSSLSGAAQIASVMLAVVFMLLVMERAARGQRQFHHTTGRYRAMPPRALKGPARIAATTACTVPFLIGFVFPVVVLVQDSITFAEDVLTNAFWQAALNSMLLGLGAAAIGVVVALTLAYAKRVAPNGFTRPAVRLTSLGYAVPGTVLAVGLLIPLAGLDNLLDGFARGFDRISPNLDAAARTLGQSAMSTLTRVHLPLMQSALGAAALLIFVDTMKELPATLLMRPFNFETMATHVYQFASLEQFEEAAIGALTIVLIGLLPVILLHRAIAKGRTGGGVAHLPGDAEL